MLAVGAGKMRRLGHGVSLAARLGGFQINDTGICTGVPSSSDYVCDRTGGKCLCLQKVNMLFPIMANGASVNLEALRSRVPFQPKKRPSTPGVRLLKTSVLSCTFTGKMVEFVSGTRMGVIPSGAKASV